MDYLTPTGECGCEKPKRKNFPLSDALGFPYFETEDALAQSRFHAEAIRKGILSKKYEQVNAVLKCMEGKQ